MREITTHKINDCNDQIKVEVLDESGSGGANHKYSVMWPAGPTPQHGLCGIHINFQNGPMKEVGTNGITHESLLAVLIDSLKGFQSGKYACRENAIALTKIEEAMMWLQKRTNERLARGVEGTHAV